MVVVAVIVPSPLLARFVAPFIAAANALPLVVLAPMFIVWFGISLASKVYFVATRSSSSSSTACSPASGRSTRCCSTTRGRSVRACWTWSARSTCRPC
ncbi:hypothetical protein BJF78_00485 [Pseudonocardia sp. CNS-139]|nr:hypothetical protein BJF78_00485 [Pseudonocardia sp. CNS-139]